MQHLMDEGANRGNTDFSERRPLNVGESRRRSFEQPESLLANPVPPYLQRVYADLRSVMVVTAVQNISRSSLEGPGWENHNPEVHGPVNSHILDFHQAPKLLLDLGVVEKVEDILCVVEEEFTLFARVLGYERFRGIG